MIVGKVSSYQPVDDRKVKTRSEVESTGMRMKVALRGGEVEGRQESSETRLLRPAPTITVPWTWQSKFTSASSQWLTMIFIGTRFCDLLIDAILTSAASISWFLRGSRTASENIEHAIFLIYA